MHGMHTWHDGMHGHASVCSQPCVGMHARAGMHACAGMHGGACNGSVRCMVTNTQSSLGCHVYLHYANTHTCMHVYTYVYAQPLRAFLDFSFAERPVDGFAQLQKR